MITRRGSQTASNYLFLLCFFTTSSFLYQLDGLLESRGFELNRRSISQSISQNAERDIVVCPADSDSAAPAARAAAGAGTVTAGRGPEAAAARRRRRRKVYSGGGGGGGGRFIRRRKVYSKLTQ